MTTRIKAALLSLALAGGSLIAAQPASADQVVVSVGPGGGIAYGYRDGYWDRARAWHSWRDAREARAWRIANRSHYYGWNHTRHGDGWRNERWWDRH